MSLGKGAGDFMCVGMCFFLRGFVWVVGEL